MLEVHVFFKALQIMKQTVLMKRKQNFCGF